MGHSSSPWAETRAQWSAEQIRLAALRVEQDELDWSVDASGRFERLGRVAGVDLSFFPDARHAVAAVVVLSFPDLEVLHECCATLELTVPYMAGYLAFREVPALVGMLRALPPNLAPQVVMFDGNGAFHPRRCGAATHLGIVSGLATVGVAKDVLLVGKLNARRAEEVARTLKSAGSWATFAEDGEDPLAAILRPGKCNRTLVVSPGHRIGLQTAVTLAIATCKAKGASLPEPIRQADLRSRKAVSTWLEGSPLPMLAPPTPSGKRQRTGADLGEAAAKDGCGSMVLLELVEADTWASASKAGQQRASRPQLVWRPKPAAPAGGPAAALAASKGPPPVAGPPAAITPWMPPEEPEPSSRPRDCCALSAVPAFFRWLFYG